MDSYQQVKNYDPDLYDEIISIASGIANNAKYLKWGELTLACAVEGALMSIASKLINEGTS